MSDLPASCTTQITLRDGRTATVRPLEAGDVELLGTYFLSLSEDTRSRYGPHPFDRATAEKLCGEIDNRQIIRFIAVLNDRTPQAEIIGYMIFSRVIWPGDVERYSNKPEITLTPGAHACLAPSVADAYQDQGVGSQMAQHILRCARETLGIKQVILMGGVLDRNARARHFYEKLGFRYVGEFWTEAHGQKILNHDMILTLEDEQG